MLQAGLHAINVSADRPFKIKRKVTEVLPFLISKFILPHQLFSFCFYCLCLERVISRVFYTYVSDSVRPGFPHYYINQRVPSAPQPLGKLTLNQYSVATAMLIQWTRD